MSALPLLSTSVLIALVGALVAGRAPERGAARRVGIRALAATGILGLLALCLVQPDALGAQLVEATPAIPGLGVRWALGIDGLGTVLLPVVSLLAAAILVAAPRAELTPSAVRAVLLVVTGTLGGMLALDAALFFAAWALALAAGRTLLGPAMQGARRAYTLGAVVGVLALGGALALVLGAGLGFSSEVAAPPGSAAAPGPPPAAETAVFVLATIAVLARMGAPPLHSWLPIALRDGGTPAAVLVLSGPSLGLSLLARLPTSLAPSASAALLEALVVVGIGSALYCALVGLGRDDLRSAVGSVVSSQSALVLVGVASLGDPGVSGALLGGLATMVPCTGLLLAIGSVAARTGTTDVTKLGGLVRSMPRATATYFVFAIALVGFPGSIAFVSEDLLLHGLVATHPAVAIALLGVTALNGLTVLRGGVRAFLGPSPDEIRHDDLTPRERGTAFVLAACIALVGLAPAPVLTLRRGMAEAMTSAGGTPEGPSAAADHAGRAP